MAKSDYIEREDAINTVRGSRQVDTDAGREKLEQ